MLVARAANSQVFFVSEPVHPQPLLLFRLDSHPHLWAQGLGIWDVAAGMLIAEEAGALTSDFLGNPNYKESDHYLCATPKCFKPMLESIKPNFKAT